MAATDQRRTAVVLSVVAIVLALIAAVRFTSGGDSGQVDELPTVDLVAVGDSTVSTDDLLGTPMVVNFWYAACPPCANELKYFAAVHEQYGDEVRFIGINAIDTVEEMTEFAGERGVTYELLQDRLAELQTDLRLTSFPTTLFVEADGTIVERTGVLDEAGLEAEVKKLLGRA